MQIRYNIVKSHIQMYSTVQDPQYNPPSPSIPHLSIFGAQIYFLNVKLTLHNSNLYTEAAQWQFSKIELKMTENN